MNTEFNGLVSMCADLARSELGRLSRSGLYPPFFLYYRESVPGKSGELRLAEDCPGSGWELAAPDPLRCGVPCSEYWQWIAARSRRLPILNPLNS